MKIDVIQFLLMLYFLYTSTFFYFRPIPSYMLIQGQKKKWIEVLIVKKQTKQKCIERVNCIRECVLLYELFKLMCYCVNAVIFNIVIY